MKRILYLFCLALSLDYLSLANAAILERTPTGNNNVATGAINTQSANTLAQGVFWIGLRNDNYVLHAFNNTQILNYSAEYNRNIESNGYFNLTSVTAAYGITNTVTLGVNLPYARLGNIRTLYAGAVSNLGNAQGMSDFCVFGQWLLFKDQSPFSAMLTMGSTLPTGADHLRDNNGNLFPPGDQPGRGTYAPYLGIAVTKTMDKSSVSANLFYTQGLVGAQKANLGNSLIASLAYVRQLYQSDNHFSLDGVMELNAGNFTRTTVAGVTNLDSGGRIFVITPGLRMTTQSKISPYIAASIPIVQSLNGIQSKLNYGITCGIDASI